MTRQIFRDTLVDLLQENELEDISVKYLCERANLNRSTFYAYYQNQVDILREIEEEKYRELKERLLKEIRPGQKTDVVILMRSMLEYLKENRKVLRVLLGTNGRVYFQEKLMEIKELTERHAGIEKSEMTTRYRYYNKVYKVAGVSRVIECWIKRDFDIPTSEMEELILKLAV